MTNPLEFETDVLVIGGGPAGTRAALAAGREGVRVMLVDKGDRVPASRAGMRVFPHSPALELLTDSAGAVRGAAGVRLRLRQHWTVHAGAVVLASGACTWRCGAPTPRVNTGDGRLMAAEVGATLTGADPSGATGIDGLWAVGGVARAETFNSSGDPADRAGRAAAGDALASAVPRRAGGRITGAGRVGLRPSGSPLPAGAWREFMAATQSLAGAFADGARPDANVLAASIAALDGIWTAAGVGLGGAGDVCERLRAREAASMIANARVALALTEELQRGLDRHIPAEIEDAVGDLAVPLDVEVTPIDYGAEIDSETATDVAAGIQDIQRAVHLART